MARGSVLGQGPSSVAGSPFPSWGLPWPNLMPGLSGRPYDLVVVPKRLASPEHYVFSPFGVLHVHPKEGSEALTLGAWHREAVLWQLLQHIPFFRLFLVRKAFAR